MKEITTNRQPMRRARTTIGCIAIVSLVAACGGDSFSRDEALDRLVVDFEFTNSDAMCILDEIEEEFGSFDVLEDPESASDEDADRIGDLLIGCIETTVARAENPPGDTIASDDAAEATTDDTAEAAATDAAVATPGAAGDWTAAQLCTLLDGAELSTVFGAVALATPVEQFEDPTRSICAWADPDSIEVVPPPLVLADQEPSPGPLFIDGTPVDIPGATEVDYRPEWLPGEDFLVLIAGDQQLTLRYRSGAPEALDVMVAAASGWAAIQAG